MFKIAAIGITALFVAASSFAHAQSNTEQAPEAKSAGEPSALTDLRIATLQSALQLTPSQQQYWPAIEKAMRARAAHRLTRLENYAERMPELSDSSPLELALNRNPIDFLTRRANNLTQRANDLKTLVDAWQPLYETLSPDQRRRVALLRIFVFRGVMSHIQTAHGRDDDDDEWYDEDEE